VRTIAGPFGGADTITASGGSNVILGGAGADSLTAGPGNNVVFGDDGIVDLAGGHPTHAVSTETGVDTGAVGGNDTINTGGGNDVLIGGPGNDTMDAGGGYNIVIGDSGEVFFGAGGAVQHAATIAPAFGGADTITGGGDNVVLAGTGPDTVTLSGNHELVLGDNGYVDWVLGPDGPVEIDAIVPTDRFEGEADTITLTGIGSNYVIGEAGGDKISAAGSDDLIFGDFGQLLGHIPLSLTVPSTTVPFTYQSVFTSEADVPGDVFDIIHAGGGRNIIVGGQGSDVIFGGPGDDDIIGGSTDPLGANGVDAIFGGGGNDVVVPGNGTITPIPIPSGQTSGGGSSNTATGGNGGTTIFTPKIDNPNSNGSGPSRSVTGKAKKTKKAKHRKSTKKKASRKRTGRSTPSVQQISAKYLP
jgi:Ca2+-binding RTX toxin-like protein